MPGVVNPIFKGPKGDPGDRGPRGFPGPPGAPGAGGGGVSVVDLGGATKTIYVRTSGSDSTGDGTSGKPYRTIQKANSTIPLLGANAQYVVDVTGITDTITDGNGIQIPQFICSQLVPDDLSKVPLFVFSAYVKYHADPVVLATLSGSASVAAESISGNSIVTDPAASWTTDEWKGKFLFSQDFGGYGTIVSNTATQLTVASENLPFVAFTGPVQIVDVGATLTPADDNVIVLLVNGVQAPIAFEGIGITGNTQACDIEDCNNVTFAGCRLQGPFGRACLDISFACCDLLGSSGGGVQTDAVIESATFSIEASRVYQMTPFIACVEGGFTGCILDGCRTFDGDVGDIELAFCWILNSAILAQGTGLFLSLFDVRVDGPATSTQFHVNELGSAIKVFGGAVLQALEGTIGGSGANGYGLEIVDGGRVCMEKTEPVTWSVTGTLGDLKVGNQPVRTWTDFGSNYPLRTQVDPTHQSRIGENVADGDPITQSGYSAITSGTGAGHDYLDVTLAHAFGAATGAGAYEVRVQISLTTDGDPIPGWALTNKTTTGFRIRFDSDFNGEVRWSATAVF